MSRRSKRKQRVGKCRTESKRYLVLCEGDSEEIYANALKQMLPRSSLRGHVVEIVKKSNPNALLKEAHKRVEKARRERLPFDGVWLFFDHDNRERMEKVFDQIGKEKWRYAFSNICFEVWLLLHFTDSPPKCAKAGEAAKKLGSYWVNQVDKKGYKKSCNHFRPLGDERRKEACTRARKLRKKWGATPLWQCNPWTNVDELVTWFESLDRNA